MKNKLLTLAAVLTLLATRGKFYATPMLAQVRAALVSDVDSPGKNFVRVEAFPQQPNGAASSSICFDLGYSVPAGKRLVIDELSAKTLNGNATPTVVELTANPASVGSPCSGAVVGSAKTISILPFAFLATDQFGRPIYATHQTMQAYADVGEALGGFVEHAASVDSSVVYDVVVSGHLVNFP